MPDAKCNTARPLLLRELTNPKYRYWLKQYAGEIAPACVAEALMSMLDKSRTSANIN